jgi:hypothetical protein
LPGSRGLIDRNGVIAVAHTRLPPRLPGVAAGQPWGDPVAGLAVTAFICHVGWEVTSDVTHRSKSLTRR